MFTVGAARPVRDLWPEGGYPILAAIMLCCLPLVSAFLRAFNCFQSLRQQPSTALWRQGADVVLAESGARKRQTTTNGIESR